jgi:hypothetical protein
VGPVLDYQRLCRVNDICSRRPPAAYDNQSTANPEAWEGGLGQPLVAQANDIIEFDGERWQISFESTSSLDNIQYVTNLTSELQYRWTGTTWVKSYQGLYPGGSWSLVL